jgi:1-acyl-sn-glycerol-3-phosphate acyltransferase
MSRLPLVPRVWRATRVMLHVARGLGTTLAVFPFIGPPRKRMLIKRWSARLLALLNVEARVQGALGAHGGNVLIVANHVSWLDIFVLNGQQPSRFVAKSELSRWPLAGRLIRGAGTIFVERARRHDTRRVNHRAAEALSSGDVVVVFPEGTTTDGTTLLRFHASLLQPIVESQGHVQPVALRYRDARGAPSAAPAYGDETIATSFWRVCGERRLVVEVIAATPIAARHLHRRELAREAECVIRAALALPPDGTAPGTRVVPAGSPR